MQKKILNNYGGLHNRVNIKIRVKPFTLGECELYMQSRNIEISRKQMTTGYMVMGGIPFYCTMSLTRFTHPCSSRPNLI